MNKSLSLIGVNLGGWFVLEKWMTPSLFEGIDARNEFELSKTAQGRQRIVRHHETFITKDDLTWLRQNGVELLRVPIGYWIFGNDERYVGAIDRLDWLIKTSLPLGLKVLLDLHAAPGAQNNAEHSGSGNTVSHINSTKWLNDVTAQTDTIEVLVRLAERYKTFPHVWGLQLLNEPSIDVLGLKLARFYRRAYLAVTKAARPGTHIVFSDAYAPVRMTNCFWLMTRREFPVVMDCHIYQVFGMRDKRRSFDGHIKRLRYTRWFLNVLSWQQPIIVGEWSAMLPQKVPPDKTKRYIAAQRHAFMVAGVTAQVYWNYKTEDPGRWNYRDQVEKELIQ